MFIKKNSLKLRENLNFNLRNDCTKSRVQIKERLYKNQNWQLYITLLRSLLPTAVWPSGQRR